MRASVKTACEAPRGFTLLELLLVVILLGLTVTAVAPQLAAADATGQRLRFTRELRDLDARARVLARTLGPVTLGVAGDGARVLLLDAKTGAVQTAVTVPDAMHVVVREVADGRPGVVHFNAAGQAADYEVLVVVGEVTQRRRVSGITGASMEIAP